MRTRVRGTGIKTKGWRVGKKPYGRACACEAIFRPKNLVLPDFVFTFAVDLILNELNPYRKIVLSLLF